VETGSPGPATGAPNPPRRAARQKSWPVIIDGWVRNQRIRRDALVGLAIVFGAAVLVAAMVAHVIDTAALSPIVIGSGAVSGIGSGIGLYRFATRRRPARSTPARSQISAHRASNRGARGRCPGAGPVHETNQ
jgi:hypothetical protein